MDLIVSALLLSVSSLFVLSGLAKLLSYRASVEHIANNEWIPKVFKKPIGYSLPIIEIICGISLIIRGDNFLVNLLMISIILVFLAVNLQAVLKHKVKDCHCFGKLIKTKTGSGGVIQTILMLLAVLPNLLVLVQPLSVIQQLDTSLLLVLAFGVIFMIYTLIIVRSLYELFNEVHI